MKLSTYFSWTLEESKTLPRNCGKEIPSDTASYSTTTKNLLSTYCFRFRYISEHFEKLHVNEMGAT